MRRSYGAEEGWARHRLARLLDQPLDGAPLFAIWVGSKVQGSFNSLSMTAVFAVIAILAITVFALGYLLTVINNDELTGRPAVARQTSPWLRSMRDERDDAVQRKYGIGGIERVVVLCAVAGVPDFEVRFFFFTGSSLPNG